MSCLVYEIPKTVLNITEEGCYSMTQKDITAVLSYIRKHDAHRGDIIRFESIPQYRNKCVLAYNGIGLLKLDTSVDDYGSIPKEFNPIEEGLPLTYWEDAIDHNTIIWIKTNTIHNNLIVSPKVGIVPRTKVTAAHCTFSYRGISYTMVVEQTDNDQTISQQLKTLKSVIQSTELVQPFSFRSDMFDLENCVFVI